MPRAKSLTPPIPAFRSETPLQLADRWHAYVARERLNTTAQRDLIVEVFLRNQDHISIDELLAKVRRKSPRVGYATVYRTLKHLVAAGLASERQFGDGGARFEVASDHHDHLICIDCHHIMEFESPEIEAMQENIAAGLGGFAVLRHSHELYGLCAKARGAGDECPGEAAGKKCSGRYRL